jgi:hypothetical protein
MDIQDLTRPRPGESLYAWDLIERLLQFAAVKPNFKELENHPDEAAVFDRITGRWDPRWDSRSNPAPSDEHHVGHWLTGPENPASRVAVFGDANVLKALRAAMEDSFRFADDEFAPFIAYAIAASLDEIFCGTAFEYEPVRKRFKNEAIVGRNTLIPTPRNADLAHPPEYPRSFNCNPRRLVYCRLAPDQEHYRLIVSTKHYDAIGASLGHASTRYGFAVLGGSNEWFFPQLPVRGVSYYCNVRPNLPDLWDRLVQVVRLGARCKVSILILPELCLTPDEQDRLLTLLRTDRDLRKSSLRIVVAGSVHRYTEDPDGDQVNDVRTALMSGRPEVFPHVVSHKKFNAFVDRKQKPWVRELLRNPHDLGSGKITIHVGKGRSLVTVCCKDFLCEHSQAMLAQLQPTHVLVPALTPKLWPFNPRAFNLATLTRGDVVVANALAAWPTYKHQTNHDQFMGLLALPDTTRNGAILAQLSRKNAKFPALCVFTPTEPPGQTAGPRKRGRRGKAGGSNRPQPTEYGPEFEWYSVR